MDETHIDTELQKRLERKSRSHVALFATVVGVLPVLVGAYFFRKLMAPVAADPYIKMFAATFMGIFLEALPFNLMGSMLSGFIEVFVSPERMSRFVPKRKSAQLGLGAVVGIAFPVCECGVVPVIRRLLKKGVPLRMTLAYLLAAPIVNPVVILSTILAFKGSPIAVYMPLFRVGIGLTAAIIIAAIVGRMRGRENLTGEIADARKDPHHTHAGPLATRLASAVDHAI